MLARRASFGLAFALAAGAALAGTSASAGDEEAAAARPSPEGPAGVEETAVPEFADAAEALEAALVRAGVKTAGVATDPETGELVVNVVATDVDRAEAISDVGQGASTKSATGSVPIRAVTYSAEDLERIRDELLDADPELMKAGVTVASWTIDSNTNRVVVGVIGNDAAAQDKVRGQLPLTDRGAIRFESAAGIAEFAAGSRTKDIPSHWGGARISSSTFSCTAGIPWSRSDGKQWVTTAAHCGLANWTWKSGGVYYGFMSQSGFSYTNIDWAGLETDGRVGRIWTSSTGYRRIYSYYSGSHASVTNLCVNGSYSGSHCGLAVWQTNACYKFSYPAIGSSSFNTCGLNAAFKSGVTPVQYGDSGGPVYVVRSDGTVTVAGTITGFNSANPAIIYYTTAASIVAGFGGTPLKG